MILGPNDPHHGPQMIPKGSSEWLKLMLLDQRVKNAKQKRSNWKNKIINKK